MVVAAGTTRDPAVGRVGDEHVSRRVDRHARGLVELTGRGVGPVPVEARGAGAGHGDHGARAGAHLLDTLCRGLGDEHVSRRVDRHRARVPEGRRPRAAAAGERGGAPGSDTEAVEQAAAGRDHQDAAVARVGHEEVPRRIEGDPAGTVEDAGSEHGAHRPPAPRPPRAAAPAPVPATTAAARRARPARATVGRRTGHIMPVAAASSLFVRP